jgi:N-acetylglucosaminyldiphosphoundecaprenol N-acetyl-beta-D-mannosaminyltransferase
MHSLKKRVNVLGVGFDNLKMDEAVTKSMGLMFGKSSEAAYIVTPNPEIVWAARENNELKEALASADLVAADGIGIIYGAKILGTPLKERVDGCDLSLMLIERLSKEGGRVFILGGKPGVSERAGEELKKKYKGIVICGTNDGYFKDDEPVIEKINAAKPDLLLVCLSYPRQEIWMLKNRGRVCAGLMMGLGGAVDIFAGDLKRAPEAWCRLGLEWLYRLLQQPSRIKRMIKLPVFLLTVIIIR